MTDARITDTAIEVAVTDTNPAARITDTAVEVAFVNAAPDARITDVAVEVAMIPGTEATFSDPIGVTDTIAPHLTVNLADPVGIVDDASADIEKEITDTVGIVDQRYQISYSTNHYIYENVGASLSPSQDARHYIYENVGGTLTPSQDARHYIYENVSATFSDFQNARHYIYEGDVDTSTPVPHIWYVRAISGSEGSQFQIVGHGFGATEGTYDGKAYLGEQGGWSDPTPIDNAYRLAVSSWQQIAAGLNAYTASRQINEYSGAVDPEHQIIVVTVYAGAVTGLVRVQTYTP